VCVFDSVAKPAPQPTRSQLFHLILTRHQPIHDSKPTNLNLLFNQPTHSDPPPTPPGTRFFPGYVSERRRAAVDRAAVAWQEDGRRRMRVLARASLAQEQAVMLPERATGGLAGAGSGASCRGVSCDRG
jgi:hypothetical protein